MPLTEENLFHFYYRWNPKKLSDPNFLSRIITIYSKNKKNIFLDLEEKYGVYPEVFDETMYTRYIEHRLYNLYKTHTTRIEDEGIEFIPQLIQQHIPNVSILMNRVITQYGLESVSVDFPLRPLVKIYEDDFETKKNKKDKNNGIPKQSEAITVGMYMDTELVEDVVDFGNIADIDSSNTEEYFDGWDVVD